MSFSSGNELRQAYLDYFKSIPTHPHTIVSSSPLIPPDDPTMLFTSAGMVQFKRFYDGQIDPLPYTRATTVQKCLRAGGKGSDLENVGKTLRHHTFFEMLGNFSFGDYFKREAIRWAWTFVTDRMGLPKERLFPTIFEDDDEAEGLWKEETDCCYTPVRLDAKQNFWGPAGDTGACGPCSELCFFMGSEAELKEIQDALAKSDDYYATLARRIDEEGDLFLEIWNMVFPQFDQQRDGSRPILKNRGIDTGAGLERMTTAMMWLRGQAATPYETDLLWPIVTATSQAIGANYVKLIDEPNPSEDVVRTRLGVNAIADHVRALCFCYAEKMIPSNEGRGYVLRRIQRRALRFASLLGQDAAFMGGLVDPVIETFGDVYPELKAQADFIRRTLTREEEAFLRVRNRGMKLLDKVLDEARKRPSKTIEGAEAFELYDTFGFPVDLTVEIAGDAGISVDREGYKRALQEQKERGKKSWRGAELNVSMEAVQKLAREKGPTEFVGYAHDLEPEQAKVITLIADGKPVPSLAEGQEGLIVLDRTPFYAESGGQVGDTGVIETAQGSVFDVSDTQKSEGVFAHFGRMESGTISAGDAIMAKVDRLRRLSVARNHSTTHLLQAALKKFVGDHVTQAGSYCGPDYLRFDFTQPEAIPSDVLRKVQAEVNRLILEDLRVSTEVLPLEEAKKKGAIAVFGEKYGPSVRVVTMGNGEANPSIEFCGGTHLPSTARAGRFRIVSEGSVASGVRRIEAVTGEAAVQQEIADQYDIVQPLQSSLAAKGSGLVERVETLSAQVKQLQKDLAKERQKGAASNLGSVAEQAKSIDGARVAVARMDGMAGNEIRTLASNLQEKIGADGIAVILAETDGKIGVAIAVGKDAQRKYPAGKAINAILQPLGGKGGGKPDFAQGGAKDVEKLDEVQKNAPELIAAL
ncbi:MAG: alanine--tRNA ligase [Sumerlaeia bacterium]